jgi:guanosine-3',5'-bis(diphosphate) 3'-pyrophosphohydrolase
MAVVGVRPGDERVLGERAPEYLARRLIPPPTASVEPILSSIALRSGADHLDVDLVGRAHEVATRAHDGQFRASGEPYIVHPVAVAKIVADLGLDMVSVAAALLHDAVEDTTVTTAEIEEEFGPAVAGIVEGVTKLDRLRFDSKEAQQAATVRKMLIAMASDWRVLVIKLADRLHNLRTIDALPVWKQQRTAQETLDIYAPLAHRLGIQELKWQLEDLSFEALHPKRFKEIALMVSARAPERDSEIAEVIALVTERLASFDIEAEVTGRPKHLWSIYEKMVVRGKEFADIYDLVAIRIIVESEKDCWAALGSTHAIWAPLPGRFKDYINSPKFNLYQSLHTTVIGPRGKPIEVQIRTREMHRRAEYGIAAHWEYKGGAGRGTSQQRGGGPQAREGARSIEELAWLTRTLDWEAETPDPIEFLENLKLDLGKDEVYVFSPKGAIVTLPAGASPVDFAYAIHTEVGHRCTGARVNGLLVPLDRQLASGDTVEIFTSKDETAGPSQDWLAIVTSPRARNKIRQWFSRERRGDALESGREELLRELRREGLPTQKFASSPGLLAVAGGFGFSDVDALVVAIGEGHVSARAVAQRLQRELRAGELEEQLPTTALQGRRPSRHRSGAGVYVEGLDDVVVRLSRCCTPVPGDSIIGFVTRGRGVSVHREDCTNAISLARLEGDRMIEVEWDTDRAGSFVAAIEVRALDRTRLLADVAKVLSEQHVNILLAATHTSAERVSRMRFEFELGDPTHLDALLSALRRLDGVYDAYRLLPGKGAVDAEQGSRGGEGALDLPTSSLDVGTPAPQARSHGAPKSGTHKPAPVRAERADAGPAPAGTAPTGPTATGPASTDTAPTGPAPSDAASVAQRATKGVGLSR